MFIIFLHYFRRCFRCELNKRILKRFVQLVLTPINRISIPIKSFLIGSFFVHDIIWFFCFCDMNYPIFLNSYLRRIFLNMPASAVIMKDIMRWVKKKIV